MHAEDLNNIKIGTAMLSNEPLQLAATYSQITDTMVIRIWVESATTKNLRSRKGYMPFSIRRVLLRPHAVVRELRRNAFRSIGTGFTTQPMD